MSALISGASTRQLQHRIGVRERSTSTGRASSVMLPSAVASIAGMPSHSLMRYRVGGTRLSSCSKRHGAGTAISAPSKRPTQFSSPAWAIGNNSVKNHRLKINLDMICLQPIDQDALQAVRLVNVV